MKEKHPQFTTIEVVDSLEALVRDSDCVYFGATATSDPNTYAKVMGEWVKPGAFIVGTSAYDVEDQFLIDKCKLVVDDIGLYDAWVQEYPYPTFGYGMDILAASSPIWFMTISLRAIASFLWATSFWGRAQAAKATTRLSP